MGFVLLFDYSNCTFLFRALVAVKFKMAARGHRNSDNRTIFANTRHRNVNSGSYLYVLRCEESNETINNFMKSSKSPLFKIGIWVCCGNESLEV